MNRIFNSFPLHDPDDDDDESAPRADEEGKPKRRPTRTAEEQSIRDEIITDRKKITTEWRKYLLDWLESPLHQDYIHAIEMTIEPNGVVTFLVDLDDEGGDQVRLMIDDGRGIRGR
jgi:hypothetical protein